MTDRTTEKESIALIWKIEAAIDDAYRRTPHPSALTLAGVLIDLIRKEGYVKRI